MYKNILLPVDLGNPAASEPVVARAVELAGAFGSRLHVMTVVPSYGMSIVGSFFPKDYEQKALDQTLEALHAYAAEHVPKEIKARHIVAHGTIYEEILRTAGQVRADLIVVGSHRPELRDYLLGPNAARVVRHADTSVLVVRP